MHELICHLPGAVDWMGALCTLCASTPINPASAILLAI